MGQWSSPALLCGSAGGRGWGTVWRWLLAGVAVLSWGSSVSGGQSSFKHPEFLIQNWQATEGVAENSALAIAQTPDGYIWVGSSGGLLRFNGYEFERAAVLADLRELGGSVLCLNTDHSGRLWASTYVGTAVLEKGRWQLIKTEGLEARSIAENVDGRVLVGTAHGKVFEIRDGVAKPGKAPAGLAASGVFLARDTRDGICWLANRSFVGRLAGEEWRVIGPQPRASDALAAAAARGGGLWVYCGGELRRYQADGEMDAFKVQGVTDPREVIEDHNGRIWIASMTQGAVGVWPGGEQIVITATNGLAHRAVRYVFEDVENNLWVGTSSSGLYRLKPRQFLTVGMEEGLPDRIVRTVTEEVPGRMLVGMHGGGTARIENGQVVWVRPGAANNRAAYAWSVLRDHQGRTWTGTFGQGLLVETNGVERSFPLPPEVGPSVTALLEDSRGRIWVGGSTGLGVIEGERGRYWGLRDGLTNFSVRAMAEDPHAGVLWVGTTHRLLQVDLQRPGQATVLTALPRSRITALALDAKGCLWVGAADQGLFRIHDSKITTVGRAQGLPVDTIGALIEDGRGYCWLSSDRGILRVASDVLDRLGQGQMKSGEFTVFDQSDGLETSECTVSFQPAAARDSSGRLWFATVRGVASVDPGKLQLNTRPPPVVFESFTFVDRSGTNHSIRLPSNAPFTVPAGSTDLEFRYAALSFTAPEKVKFAYRLEGSANWVEARTRRVAAFHSLAPGQYRLQVKAANNDGLWNETGAAVAFRVQPFVWQTLWFRFLTFVGVAAGIGYGGWRLARAHYQRQVERIETQHALEQERARLAAVMDATSDLVAFADRDGRLLYLNPAGRRLLGFGADEGLGELRLTSLFPGWAAKRVEEEGISSAGQRGTWEAELAVQKRGGQEVPVSQVLVAQKDAAGQLRFLSTIARDISERKRAEEEKDRLNSQLAQAQKMESVGRLAGGVAHDFNNMLQVILGNVELLLDHTPPTSEARQDLETIRKSAEHSAELTRQLLAFARRQVISPRVLDLNETVSGMLKMLRRLIGEDIQLIWNPGPSLWLVRMDPAQIDQILANLAVNAREAIIGEGRVTVRTANTVVREGSPHAPADCPFGEYVMLTVSDSGKGMTREVQAHLFEPFFTTKGLGQGTGLGLATIFGIVKQNHGAVSVQSESDQGTTFRIYLPRAIVPSEGPEAEAPVPPSASGTKTILLVEDERQILELGKRLLEQHGYRVLTAALPQDALNLVAEYSGRIDLLLTDVVMPNMNGKQVMQRLRALYPDLQVLFMSGHTADVIADEGVLDAGVEFIQKPFRAQEILEKVQRLLRKSQSTVPH